MICFAAQRVDLHMDEYWTFALANHPDGIYPVIQDGVAYQADDVYLPFMTAKEGHLFDYRMVWENQAADVHPPFYYVLIHTVCSFFPGQFSPWFGIGVNLVLFVLSAVLFYRLALLLSGRASFSLLAAALYGFCPGIVNAVLYIRMYMLMTVWVLLLLLLFTRYYSRPLSLKFYLALILISFCGAMTHYYFLIFLLFACLFFGVRTLCRRRWKETACFCGSMGCAAALSIACFPAMLPQIFGGDSRGGQAFENASHLSDWSEQIRLDFAILNNQLFGGFFFLLTTAAALLLLWTFRHRLHRLVRQAVSPAGMMAVCAVCYFLLVAKIAPYYTDRYFIPIFPICILLCVYALSEGLRRLSGRRARALLCTGAVMAGCYSCSYANGLPYLYEDKIPLIAAVQQHGDAPAIFLYQDLWNIIPDYRLLQCHASVTYCNASDIQSLRGRLTGLPDGVMVYRSTYLDEKTVLQSLFEQNPSFSRCEKLFRYEHTDVYWVE